MASFIGRHRLTDGSLLLAGLVLAPLTFLGEQEEIRLPSSVTPTAFPLPFPWSFLGRAMGSELGEMRSVPVLRTKTSWEKHILLSLDIRLLVPAAGQQNGRSHSCIDARCYDTEQRTTKCIYLGNAGATARHVKPEVLGMCLCLPGKRENSGHQLLCSDERPSCSCIIVHAKEAFCLDCLGRSEHAKSTRSTTSTDAKPICYSLI